MNEFQIRGSLRILLAAFAVMALGLLATACSDTETTTTQTTQTEEVHDHEAEDTTETTTTTEAVHEEEAHEEEESDHEALAWIEFYDALPAAWQQTALYNCGSELAALNIEAAESWLATDSLGASERADYETTLADAQRAITDPLECLRLEIGSYMPFGLAYFEDIPIEAPTTSLTFEDALTISRDS